jgi:hypothetical protein
MTNRFEMTSIEVRRRQVRRFRRASLAQLKGGNAEEERTFEQKTEASALHGYWSASSFCLRLGLWMPSGD